MCVNLGTCKDKGLKVKYQILLSEHLPGVPPAEVGGIILAIVLCSIFDS
jgi:hypothetical protein